MLHEIHEHINQEIRLNTRTDTIFIITAIIFNFIILASGSGLASDAAWELSNGNVDTSLVVLIINIVISLLVNTLAITGLLTGRGTRKTLMQGLLKMYEDTEVSKYYHISLLTNYTRRYVMFIAIVIILGVASILIPLVVLLMGG